MGIWLVMPLRGVGTARTALCIGLIPAAESGLRHSALFGYVLCIKPWVSRSDFGSHLLRWQGSQPDGSCWSVPLCQLVQHTFNSLVPRRAEWPEVRERNANNDRSCEYVHACADMSESPSSFTF
ncbi:hypothetical protein EDB81DRAFT_806393 [Dactylonectria macrodidyma]|uniref:Secreted protein n=1 Tax=Dactylonectria macrodidyma TaxID=307937 RepID=A0A9P9E8X8_9HYPO|nr:hypothetical protein EDB81DRAFT_806393 [Dactylonectria macrodidyma]